jgi:hypothetical protein
MRVLILDATGKVKVTKTGLLGRCIVPASLPLDVLPDPMLNDAANQKVDKKGEAQNGNSHVIPGKV